MHWRTIVHGELQVLWQLRDNWDSYGAKRIAKASIDTIWRVVDVIIRQQTPMPSFVPCPHGGIQLEWHRNGIDLEIEVKSDETVSAFFQDRTSGEEWERDVTADLSSLKAVVERLDY